MVYYTRALSYRMPMLRGYDVLALQQRMRELGYDLIGQPDGLFGKRSDDAVRKYQLDNALTVDGVVGPRSWSKIFETSAADAAMEKLKAVMPELRARHKYLDSKISWRLTEKGILIDAANAPETFGGEPTTVRKVWQSFGSMIEEWANGFGVPVELIVATICTESEGDPKAVREEPGYVSDSRTPNKVSPGLMQTLISTARGALGDDAITRNWLLEPGNSIRAGTAYIAQQFKSTHFDPPKVACAYNAGSLRYNNSERNRWKMLQYPINTGEHADRFVKWFNECFVMFEKDDLKPRPSFYVALKAGM